MRTEAGTPLGLVQSPPKRPGPAAACSRLKVVHGDMLAHDSDRLTGRSGRGPPRIRAELVSTTPSLLGDVISGVMAQLLW
ncbi:hypothetical protein GCM10010425_50450 [Streptomyces spororaveus]|uniref:Uncharacterized protein n=1 Tax=Streptomyces spororaveus TaxID=284039 RepID=A0ABQ3T2L7_9ACTN|nr:hypothetical protein Sspor_02000 [Streptomyces spororaveus]